MTRSPFYTPLRIATFVVLMAVALTLAQIPVDPGRDLPGVGATVAADLLAPHDLDFVSEIRTEEAREDAAAAVSPRIVFDAGVEIAQVAVLTTLVDAITAVRTDGTVEEERSQALRANPALDVSQSVQVRILELTALQWDLARGRAEAELQEILSQSITEDRIEEIRAGVPDAIRPGLTTPQREVVVALVQPLIRATVTEDVAATAADRQAARQGVLPVLQQYADGDVIVPAGSVVEPLHAEAIALIPSVKRHIPGDDLVAMMVLSVLAAIVLGVYLVVATPDALASNRRLLLVGVLVVASVAAARLYLPQVLPDEQGKYLDLAIPIATGSVLIAALLERTAALLVAAIIGVLAGVVAVVQPDFQSAAPEGAQALRPMVVYLFAGVAGVYSTYRVERLTQYSLTGLVVGATVLLGGIAFWLLDPARETEGIGWLALVAVIVALGTAVATIGAFSVLGSVFRITTRLQLLELAQLTHPLLRRLQEEAPGTFHHSLLVSTMSERAAAEIGADALLVRVGAYYHDVGKLAKPHMYVENQSGGANPHDALDPLESANVIREHVRWGMELGRRHRLPDLVRAFIPEHHGTRLVTYFYRKAAAENPDLDAALFAYPGPRPQSRETSVVMLADSCEAVVRSSNQREMAIIDRLVDGVINERLNERQLDECNLTLRQLQMIAESFKVTLGGVYHPRIEYPEPTAGEARHARPTPPGPRLDAPPPVGDAPVDGTAPPSVAGLG